MRRDQRLSHLIRQTPSLDWLLLTKRPENIREYLPPDWGSGYRNTWLGVSVEDQKFGLPRIDILREIPAAVRFLSVEPLLEDLGVINLAGIHWVIVGGETGSRARSMDLTWVESIIAQCELENVAVWVKQLGRKPTDSGADLVILEENGKRSHKADTMSEWPNDVAHLRVRQLPVRQLDQVAMSANEVNLNRIDSELRDLASELPGDLATREKALRPRLLDVERSLFLSRAEKGRILLEFKAIYGPLRKWSKFPRIIKVPRQSAYDLVSAVKCTIPVQSPSERQRKSVTVDQAVNKASASVSRLFESLGESDKTKAAEQLVSRLTADYGVQGANLGSLRLAA